MTDGVMSLLFFLLGVKIRIIGFFNKHDRNDGNRSYYVLCYLLFENVLGMFGVLFVLGAAWWTSRSKRGDSVRTCTYVPLGMHRRAVPRCSRAPRIVSRISRWKPM